MAGAPFLFARFEGEMVMPRKSGFAAKDIVTMVGEADEARLAELRELYGSDTRRQYSFARRI